MPDFLFLLSEFLTDFRGILPIFSQKPPGLGEKPPDKLPGKNLLSRPGDKGGFFQNLIRGDGLTGQLGMDRQGNAVAGCPLEGIGKERVVKMFREKTIPLMLLEKDVTYANFVDPAVEKAHKAVSTPVPRVGEYTGGDIYQAIAYVDEKVTLAELEDCCKLTRWSDFAVDIIAKKGGKVAGIQAFLEKYGISREETMAFGDGENDMEMLEFVQVGVAMGNAEDCVKKIADYVTDTVDDDGIEKALIDLGLLA